MNREQILAIAEECGIEAWRDTLCRYEGWEEPMIAFAARIESLVRERAALECEQRGNMHKDLTPESLEAFECAAAIRKSEG
jgi:hypothetical protein